MEAVYQETFDSLKEKMSGLVPEFELAEKAELVYKINKLKKEKKMLFSWGITTWNPSSTMLVATLRAIPRAL